MSVSTQYNPNVDLNARLIAAGASKTVYALVTPYTRVAKGQALTGIDGCLSDEYFDMFEEPWTKKQDAFHEEFFDAWVEWSRPVVDFDRSLFPFYYPTAGASEAIRHIIYSAATRDIPSLKALKKEIHFFEGEYEGYRAMAEAAGLTIVEHPRDSWETIGDRYPYGDEFIFFVSQPSAIDGNVWHEFNDFLESMPHRSVVVDVTYVGAIPEKALNGVRFDLTAPSIRNVVFSLSKPFGVYYDRIGGVWFREEDPGLFGNKWFKNLTSLKVGTSLLKTIKVFELPEAYRDEQMETILRVGQSLDLPDLEPSDVYILATGKPDGSELSDYLNRAGRTRVCLTPGMDRLIKENWIAA